MSTKYLPIYAFREFAERVNFQTIEQIREPFARHTRHLYLDLAGMEPLAYIEQHGGILIAARHTITGVDEWIDACDLMLDAAEAIERGYPGVTGGRA